MSADVLVVDGVSGLLHLGFKDGSYHWYATTTTRTGLGFGLDLTKLLHATLDTRTDGAFGDILAVSSVDALLT